MTDAVTCAASLDAYGLVANLNGQAKENKGYAVVSKYIGGTQDSPTYPLITLKARICEYGTPTASVTVERTRTCKDTTCSLDDLDIRTACEYYLHLDSVDAVNAIEKAVRASTPKAWSFITLLDRMRKEIER